ncbi:hypothetical protein ACLOJK_038870 [Asimina triloba]
MVNYSFPILSTAEIVSNLSQLEIATVKPNAITNPTLDFLISLYTAFLTFLDPLGDDPAHMDFSTLELLENPDLHVHSVRIMNLYYKVKDLVNAACSMNFTLKDLVNPQRDRTVHFISGILNLCLYRQDKLNVLHPMVEKVGDCEQQCLELEARIAELSKEIEDHEEARRMEQPKVQEVEVEVKELRQTIQSLNKQQLSLKSSFRTIKDKSLEINDKISSADFELVQSVQENAKLRSKIVQSPDKLQRALDEKKSVRTEATNAERSAMQCFQERTCTLEVYSKVSNSLIFQAHKKLSKRLAHMQALQEQVNSAKVIDKDVKVLKARLGDEAVLDMSLEAKIVDREGKCDLNYSLPMNFLCVAVSFDSMLQAHPNLLPAKVKISAF